VIFVSIDDDEVHNLRKVMDEVFGEDNFIWQIVWQTRFSPISLTKNLSQIHEYVLIYSKNQEQMILNDLPRSDKQNTRYKNIDNDSRWPWTSWDCTCWPLILEKTYELTTPSWRIVKPAEWLSWMFTKKRMQEMIEDNRIWFWENWNNMPRLKRFLSEVRDWIVPTTFFPYQETWWNQWATKETIEIFWGKKYFDYPKPLKLLKLLFKIWSTENDIILDFFAWSWTTAHAVMELNKEDWWNRKFICVQLPEKVAKNSEAEKAWYKFISQITRERIKRAGEKIKNENIKNTVGNAGPHSLRYF
jgi:adenine-specific DNA-methyltransferase